MINWALRAVLALALVAAGWQVFQQLVARQVSRFLSGPEAFEEAIRWDPEGAGYHLALGLHYLEQLDPELVARARPHLERATELNPFEPRTLQELATLYEIAGDRELAERAHLSALELRPTQAELLWRAGNFYLRSGDLQKALPQLGLAMESDPSLVRAAADLLLSVGVAPSEVERLVPRSAKARRLLLDVLTQRLDGGSPEPILFATMQVWREQLELRSLSAEQGVFVINRLTRAGLVDVARREWAALNDSAGHGDRAFEELSNLVWNGDFERPVVGGDLDWVLPSIDSYVASIAEGEGVAGSNALRVDVRGRVPRGLERVGQQVVVEPGRSYELSARLRARGLGAATPRLVVLPVVGRRPIASLEAPAADGAWHESRVEFEVRDRTGLIVIRLDDQFNPGVEGSVWIDSIVLSPGR